MSSQDELVIEFNASVEDDLKKRKRSIDQGEALDKEINRRSKEINLRSKKKFSFTIFFKIR